MKRLITITMVMALGAIEPVAAQNVSLGVTTRFDDNLSFARAKADVVEDISVQAIGSLNWHKPLNLRTSTDIRTSLSLQHYLRTENFDVARLDVALALNRKIGLGNGLAKPLLSLEGSSGWQNSEERFRSGLPYGLKASARSRLSNQAVLGYRLSWSGFEPETTYEVPVGVTQRGDSWRWQMLEAGVTYSVPLGQRFGASLDLAAYDGDLVFSTVPTFPLNSFAKARSPDHALGDGFYAYRVEGQAWQSSLNLSYTPSLGQQLQLCFGRMYSRSDAGFGYDRTWVELRLSQDF
jgi:hypothetical protein